jgi:2'-5' RNA ligase
VSPAGEKARLFVALDLPEEVRSAVVGWQDENLAAMPSLRVVSPESLHVTLCFLGWHAIEAVEAIGAATMRGSATAPDLVMGAPVWLPRRRPRVIALEVDDAAGACVSLQSAVSDSLVEGAFYEREKRPFFPHVTVGRVRGGTPRALGREDLPAPPALRFSGAAVTLYRSRPTSRGATYEALLRHSLPAT